MGRMWAVLTRLATAGSQSRARESRSPGEHGATAQTATIPPWAVSDISRLLI